jgi:hypothetical protein
MNIWIVILLIGGLFFLLLIAGVIFAVSRSSNGDKDQDEDKDEGKKEEKEVIIYKCHGSNFSNKYDKYDTVCPNDKDFVWSEFTSCDRDDLLKMQAEGEIGRGCPAQYTYLEGPELKLGQKCGNKNQAWGFKCYKRSGYYDYDSQEDSFSGVKSLNCCLGKHTATECSGRMCPGSAVCNKIVNQYCGNEQHSNKPECQTFCTSGADNGFPTEIPQKRLIDAYGDDFKLVIIEK